MAIVAYAVFTAPKPQCETQIQSYCGDYDVYAYPHHVVQVTEGNSQQAREECRAFIAYKQMEVDRLGEDRKYQLVEFHTV